MKVAEYDREAAVAYAKKWAYGRNPRYYDFSQLGGDCTNFVSQCLFAGAKVQNFSPDNGWYYISSYRRAPSWTAANLLNKFLKTNEGAGPMGILSSPSRIRPGDVISLSFNPPLFTHSLLVVETEPKILVAAHTFDTYGRDLDTYFYQEINYIHIFGVGKP